MDIINLHSRQDYKNHADFCFEKKNHNVLIQLLVREAAEKNYNTLSVSVDNWRMTVLKPPITSN